MNSFLKEKMKETETLDEYFFKYEEIMFSKEYRIFYFNTIYNK